MQPVAITAHFRTVVYKKQYEMPSEFRSKLLKAIQKSFKIGSFLLARRYASRVFAMVMGLPACLSVCVCLTVCHKSVFYRV